jgi:hypothetical protein
VRAPGIRQQRKRHGVAFFIECVLFAIPAVILLVFVPYGLSWWIGVLVFLAALAVVNRAVDAVMTRVVRHPRFANRFANLS